MRSLARVVAAVTVAVLTVAGCSSGSDDAADDGSSGSATVLEVPSEYPTIQEAVDRAEPGDLVLVSPGPTRRRSPSRRPTS